MKRLRVYTDTSVIGGVFDPQFSQDSILFFEKVKRGDIIFLISDLVVEEIRFAPVPVRQFFESLPEEFIQSIEITIESETLRDAYLKEGVVGESSVNDAHHVAIATIAKADLIVSWNFKHFVHIGKIRRFNAVNLKEGYSLIDIRSPREVIGDE